MTITTVIIDDACPACLPFDKYVKYVKDHFSPERIEQATEQLGEIIGKTHPDYTALRDAFGYAKPKAPVQSEADKAKIAMAIKAMKEFQFPGEILKVSGYLAGIAGDVYATQKDLADIQAAYGVYLKRIATACRNHTGKDDALDGKMTGSAWVRGEFNKVMSKYMADMGVVQSDRTLTDLLNEVERKMDERDARWIKAAFGTMAR
jgi:hypothetical protein